MGCSKALSAAPTPITTAVHALQGALDAEDSAPGFSLEAPADEPPATPPPSALPASPAHLAPAPTPTGLGLSSLAPMSPLAPTAILGANTPVATPMQGVPSGQQAKVYDTLSAAAKVKGAKVLDGLGECKARGATSQCVSGLMCSFLWDCCSEAAHPFWPCSYACAVAVPSPSGV